jgi:hypothetical protein
MAIRTLESVDHLFGDGVLYNTTRTSLLQRSADLLLALNASEQVH